MFFSLNPAIIIAKIVVLSIDLDRLPTVSGYPLHSAKDHQHHAQRLAMRFYAQTPVCPEHLPYQAPLQYRTGVLPVAAVGAS